MANSTVTGTSTNISVPILDMDDLKNLPGEIVRACEERGYFRLKNHGIPLSLMADMKGVVRSFHELPLQAKMKNFNPDEPAKGYTPPNMGGALFDSLSLYDMASPPAIDAFCIQMDASPHQREIIEKYTSALLRLAQFIGGTILEGLGAAVAGAGYRVGICQLKMNRYSYSPKTVGLTGTIMHTDTGLFTILHDDENVNGLEAVDDATGQLVSVDPVPGTIVINVGDAGKVWSNGRFCNVKHRVQCYKPSPRFTLALSVMPSKDEKVAVLQELISFENPARYVPFDFEEYRKLRISTSSSNGEALDYFKASQTYGEKAKEGSHE